MAQVLFFNMFFEKDPHLKAVERVKLTSGTVRHSVLF